MFAPSGHFAGTRRRIAVAVDADPDHAAVRCGHVTQLHEEVQLTVIQRLAELEDVGVVVVFLYARRGVAEVARPLEAVRVVGGAAEVRICWFVTVRYGSRSPAGGGSGLFEVKPSTLAPASSWM